MTLFKRKHLAIYLLCISTILLLGLLFPNTLRFKYEFEEGKIWRYNDLISPYDFGILKPDEDLQREYAGVDSIFRSHYVKDQQKIDAVLIDFENDFQKTTFGQTGEILTAVNRNPEQYLNYAKALLRKYYDRGIVKIDSLQSPDDLTSMQVLEGNEFIKTQPIDAAEVHDQIRNELANSTLPHVSFLYPLLSRHIHPNINFDKDLINRLKSAEKAKIAVTRGKVSRGELIVARDAVITQEISRRLMSYRVAHERQVAQNKSPWFVWGGYFILMCLLIGVFTFYFWQWIEHRPNALKILIFIHLWILVYSFITYLVESNGTLSVYMIPYCIAPIVLKTFFEEKFAFSTYVILIITVALIFSFGFEFILLQVSAGLVAIVSNKVTRYWSPFFRSILLIGCTYIIGSLSLTFIKEGTIKLVEWEDYTWFLVNILLVLLAYPLVPLLERIFGFTSAISLAELGDVNRPLLKELSLKAPGTFQHSLQVANIAEAAADSIGADSLLLRVSALYHDIGKMQEPEIFIENQGEYNPHRSLTAQESAEKIINHVVAGAIMAKKHRLPKPITDMILSHHGTTRVEYFFKASEQGNLDLRTNEASFRYPGPKPVTREEVILMLADSIEAACKSLKNPTETDIRQMIDRIFSGKQASAQFSESEISYREMEKIRNSLYRVLQSIYHIRIEYPTESEEQIASSS